MNGRIFKLREYKIKIEDKKLDRTMCKEKKKKIKERRNKEKRGKNMIFLVKKSAFVRGPYNNFFRRVRF